MTARYADEWAADYDLSRAALWGATYRRVIRSAPGRHMLRGLRNALYALPERRLITSAVCTVGGAGIRAPLMTDAEAANAAEYASPEAFDARWWATLGAPQRAAEHAWLASLIADCGEGVCAVGAYAWHQLVRAGNDPDTAFLMLPTFGASPAAGEEWDDDDEGMARTAAFGELHGLGWTLGWEITYRNDVTYSELDPRQRWVAFAEWINVVLGDHPYPELLGTEVPRDPQS